MTEPVHDPLGNLITLLSEVLADVRQGRLVALERMGDEFESLYTLVQDQDHAKFDEAAYKARLKTLNRLRAHLADAVSDVRGQTVSKLGSVALGKRGLRAYKATVTVQERGVKRGEG